MWLSKTFLFLVVTVFIADVPPTFSIDTHFIIKNFILADVVDTAIEIANPDDWEDGQGVKGNAMGLIIPLYRFVDLIEKLASDAESNYFNMTLYYNDASTDTFSANLRSAINEGAVDLQQSGDHRIAATALYNENTLLITINAE
ncbi:uncharacterized protein LOC135142326 [Zophobas morio]